MDKTGWEAIEYSSEETAGEGTNGRAQQTVDSDDDTYWHPQWYGSTAQLPHYIVVDMQDEAGNAVRCIMAAGNNNESIWAVFYKE